METQNSNQTNQDLYDKIVKVKEIDFDKLENEIIQSNRELMRGFVRMQKNIAAKSFPILLDEIKKANNQFNPNKSNLEEQSLIPDIDPDSKTSPKPQPIVPVDSKTPQSNIEHYDKNPKIPELKEEVKITEPKDDLITKLPLKAQQSDIVSYLESKGYDILDLNFGLINETILGTFQKSLLYRFESISAILQESVVIDLKTYYKIDQFITKEKKYYDSIIGKKNSNLLEDFFEIDDGVLEKRIETLVETNNLTPYIQKSILSLKELYNKLIKFKTKDNQLPQDEILDILKGKKLDGTLSYKHEENNVITYLKGNHFWDIRCKNILTYFNSHKEQNLGLIDYVIDLLIDESNKLKTQNGEPKISSYLEKILVLDRTAEHLRTKYNAIAKSKGIKDNYKKQSVTTSLKNPYYESWNGQGKIVHNVSRASNLEEFKKPDFDHSKEISILYMNNYSEDVKKEKSKSSQLEIYAPPVEVAEYISPRKNPYSPKKNPFLEDYEEVFVYSTEGF